MTEDIRIVLSDTPVFKECINAVGKLVDEATIHTTPECLEITALDPANVALVALSIAASEFLEYGVKEDTKFAIKLSGLRTVLSRAHKDSVTTLSIEKNQLKIVHAGKVRKEFTLPLLDDLEDKQQKMPALKFNVEALIDVTELSDAVADVSVVGESCEFKVVDKKLTISASGDTSRAVSETKAVVTELGEDKVAKAIYSIEYLDKIFGRLSKNIRISLAKDYPMRTVCVNDKATITITHILAPRIQD